MLIFRHCIKDTFNSISFANLLIHMITLSSKIQTQASSNVEC